MEKLFSKLDLNDYVKAFQGFLAREKPLFIEGDVHVHYRLISELERYDGIKSLPSMISLERTIKSNLLKIAFFMAARIKIPA